MNGGPLMLGLVPCYSGGAVYDLAELQLYNEIADENYIGKIEDILMQYYGITP
jgi:hypothetical protein